jgi:hypothetical protein
MRNPISDSHAATAESINNPHQKCHSKTFDCINNPNSVFGRPKTYSLLFSGNFLGDISTDVFLFLAHESQRIIIHYIRTLDIYSICFFIYTNTKKT